MLKEADNKLDAMKLFERAVLPFATSLLNIIHSNEDLEAENKAVSTIKLYLSKFFTQSLCFDGIEPLCTEFNDDKEFNPSIHEIMSIEKTNSQEQNKKIYRTISPGIRHKDYIIKEKVSVWKYEEN